MQPVLFVRFYCSATGNEPVRDWIKDKMSADARKVIGADIKTVQFGWPIGMPVVRKLEVGLWEVRSSLPESIARVVFTVIGANMVLLHGFVKKSQGMPREDLEIARKRMKEVRK